MSLMTNHPVRVDPAATFEATIRPVLEEVRTALAIVVERISPIPRRAAELQRTLTLDSHLSWSVFSAANAQDALAVAALLPGERAVGKFLDRARANGVAPDVVNRAERAFAEFDRTAQIQAGGREMFEAMVAGLTVDRPNADSDTDLRNKRAAFRAVSMLWGRQAQQLIDCVILHPSTQPGLLDRAYVGALVGMRQTRPGSSLNFRQRYSRLALEGDASPPPIESLGTGAGEDYPMGMIPALCSESAPRFRVYTDELGDICHEVMHRTIGATDEFTCVWGHVSRAYDAVPGSTPGASIEHIRAFTTPVELTVVDMVVHESIWDTRLPEVAVYEQDVIGRPVDIREADRMALREQVTLLGRGMDAARSPEIPKQAEMLAYAFDHLGWNHREFRIFRCRVEYPLLHTRLLVRLKANT